MFFEAEGACYIVSGEIAQDAVCKLWVIPEGRMTEKKTEEQPKEPSAEETQKRGEVAAAVAKAAALKAALLTTRLHADASAT